MKFQLSSWLISVTGAAACVCLLLINGVQAQGVAVPSSKQRFLRNSGRVQPDDSISQGAALALHQRTDKFSDAVDAFAEKWGQQDGSPLEMEAFYQEMQDFHVAMTANPVAVSKASFDEKVTMVKEIQRSFSVVERILSLMETSNTTMFLPFVSEMKNQMLAAESMTDDVLELLDDMADDKTVDINTADVHKPDNSSPLQAKTRRSHRRLNNYAMDDDFSASRFKPTSFAHQDASDGEYYHKSWKVYHERDDADQHWHGFKDHRQYRSWKGKHTSTNPHSRHIFDAMEDLHTGNFGGLRERVLRKGDHMHEKYHRPDNLKNGRRKLTSTQKRAQCDLFLSCAKTMNLYDMVFYHFSDYIDTTSGRFAENFRVPRDFDILEVEASIKAAIAKVEKQKETQQREQACSDLLDLFHQNEATKDPDYWNWRAGAVSEVCYASGTTKKIDLYLIKEHIGEKAATRVLQETLEAAKVLYDTRDQVKHKDEPFVYLDADEGVRFPKEVHGLSKDSEGRPELRVNLEEFYSYGKGYVQNLNELTQMYGKGDICPGNLKNGGIGIDGDLQCSSSNPKVSVCTPFLVIGGSGIYLLPTTDLPVAKTYLGASVALGGSRLILEVKNGDVNPDPHEIAGYKQDKKNGFNNKWDDWDDVNQLVRHAQLFVNATQTPDIARIPKFRDYFLLVAGDHVVKDFFFYDLNDAKDELSNQKGSRCIVEIKDGIAMDPAITNTEGFAKHWDNDADKKRLTRVAQSWADSNDVFFIFVVGSEDKAVVTGFFSDVETLLKEGKRVHARGESFQMFVVQNGEIQIDEDSFSMRDGYIINYDNQAEERRQLEVAQQSIASLFYLIVWQGHGVQGYFYSYHSTLMALGRIAGKRAAFAVFNGEIQDPHKLWLFQGGIDVGNIWDDWDDINAMMKEAQDSLSGLTCSPRPSIAEQGADDEYAGWYDLHECGQCNYYCSWIGSSGSGGDPSVKTEFGESKWVCQKNGVDSYSYPLPFNFKRCNAIDPLLNSTRSVFGDTSPGQIAALAEVGKEPVKFDEAFCPGDWELAEESKNFDPSSQTHGIRCVREYTVACEEDCAKKQCADTGGQWITDVDNTFKDTSFSKTPFTCFYGKGCPSGWSGSFAQNGLECTKTLSQQCGTDCAEKQCGDHGGSLLEGEQQATFEAFGTHFSLAMSEEGDVKAVGQKGAVTIYRKGSTTLTVKCKGASCSPNFGKSVAVSADGSTLAVGQVGDKQNDGHVRLFGIDGDEPVELWTFFNADNDSNTKTSSFGTSLALSGNGKLLLVGQPGHQTNNGRVILYEHRSPKNWQEIFSEAWHTPNAQLGASVAMSKDGSKLVAGGKTHAHEGVQGTGVASVWEKEGAAYKHKIDFFGDDGSSEFGSVVSMSADGQIFVASAPGWNNGANTNSGKFKAFKRGNKGWNLLKQVEFDWKNHRVGSSMAISPDGKHLAVGSIRGGGSGGMAMVYNTKDWTEETAYGEGDALHCGAAVSISNSGSWMIGCKAGFVALMDSFPTTSISVTKDSMLKKSKEGRPGTTFTCTLPDTYTLERKPALPGFCCLDTPDVSGIWGEPYTCKSECKNYAPSLAGISVGTCDIFGGTFCPYEEAQECSPLKRCVARYLKAAKALEGQQGWNPTYVQYLSDMPNITDATNAHSCGRAREYFGFDPTFPIDLKICDEIEEYKNAQELGFMNDVFEQMPSSGKSIGSGGKGVGGSDGGKVVDEKFEDIVTVAKAKLKDAGEPDSKCNADALTSWQSLRFGFLLAFEVTEDLYDALEGFECPEDLTGIVKSLCAGIKNISMMIFLITRGVARSILELTNHLLDATTCGNLDPQSQGEMFEATKALTENLGSVYNVIAERQTQTHTGINALGTMMNNQVDKVKEVEASLTSKFEDVSNNLKQLTASLTAKDGKRRFLGEDLLDDSIPDDLEELKAELKSKSQDAESQMAGMKSEMAAMKTELSEQMSQIQDLLKAVLLSSPSASAGQPLDQEGE
ncbi:expressed unknown protein [Seminavis robusta]|uniref:Uncharacterized protein n=1 Tax=Seminavis robusta TaxID=568900 RepID=A0A9N8EMZ5_9STRA|nr:expressed unknown protein [Seminavis robusta]|eukprot:Sro1584_g284040.1 n/a (1984) ;mRNA; f:17041-23718